MSNVGTARQKWQQHVATALTDWRLFSIGPRPNIRYEEQLIRSAISEILAIRLEEAYAPIFRTLQRIEGKVGALANLRAEPKRTSKAPTYHKMLHYSRRHFLNVT